MSALERVDQIRAGAQNVQSFFFGGGRSFEDVLDAALPGGPVSDQVGGLDSLVSVLAAEATGFESAIGLPRTETVSNRAPGAIPAADATSWTALLPERGRPWADAIDDAATEHGLDPRLLAAVVWSESAFDPAAVSSAGAIGLGQLMPGTAAELGVDPHDPIENLDGAARYLSTQINRFGRNDLGLAAYNAGPGRVASAGGIPQIAETRAYVHVVLDRYVQLGGNQ